MTRAAFLAASADGKTAYKAPRQDFKVSGNNFVSRDGQTYNYNPTNFFQRPDDRMNMGFFGKYEISDKAEVYMDFTLMNVKSDPRKIFVTAS